jgi:hypothetical protein
MSAPTPNPPSPSTVRIVRILLVGSLILAFGYGGVYNISNALRFRTPPVTTLNETPAIALPTYVTLKDITLDVEHSMKLMVGSEVLYIPVRARTASPNSEYPVVIQTSAADLIAAVRAKSPEGQKYLTALAARGEVTGRTSALDGRRLKSMREQVPLIARNAVLIDDGATPSLIYGAILLSIALGVLGIAIAGGFKQASPATPEPGGSGSPGAERPAATNGVEVDIAWGGYYVSQEPPHAEYRVWRLLDFSQTAYHVALFTERFRAVPTLAEVTALRPFVGHVPLDTRALLSSPIQLIGTVPLSPDDLEGYMTYLEHHDVPAEQRAELASRLISFSKEAPLRLRLAVIDDQVQVSEQPGRKG